MNFSHVIVLLWRKRMPRSGFFSFSVTSFKFTLNSSFLLSCWRSKGSFNLVNWINWKIHTENSRWIDIQVKFSVGGSNLSKINAILNINNNSWTRYKAIYHVTPSIAIKKVKRNLLVVASGNLLELSWISIVIHAEHLS